MKRLLVGIAVMGLVMTGCSKSTESVKASDKSSTTASEEDSKETSTTASDDPADAEARASLIGVFKNAVTANATDEQAGCWADAVIDKVGAKDALTLANEDPSSPASEAVQKVATEAVVNCSEPWEMVVWRAQASGQTVTEEQIACLKDGFDEATSAEFEKGVLGGGEMPLSEALMTKCIPG